MIFHVSAIWFLSLYFPLFFEMPCCVLYWLCLPVRHTAFLRDASSSSARLCLKSLILLIYLLQNTLWCTSISNLSPGAIYYLSAWYTKKELGKRLAGLYIAQQVGNGNAFGGLFAAAILQLDGAHGIAGWKWLFIIEGSAMVGIGAICACIMPEFPHNSRVLSQTERDLAVWRVESEAGAAEGTEGESTMSGFIKTLSDPKLLLLIFCNLLSQGQGSIANYFPTLVAALGYSGTVSLLLTAPPYILAGFVYYGITFYSDRKNTLYPIIITCIAIATVMYIIPMATDNVGARYFSMMILPFASVGPQILLYKTMNLHLARPVSKRAAASALINATGGTSNIWTSYLYYAPPHFYTAFGALMGCAVLFAATITVYRWLVLRENRRLDSGDQAEIAKAIKGGVTQEMVSLGWRYEMYEICRRRNTCNYNTSSRCENQA